MAPSAGDGAGGGNKKKKKKRSGNKKKASGTGGKPVAGRGTATGPSGTTRRPPRGVCLPSLLVAILFTIPLTVLLNAAAVGRFVLIDAAMWKSSELGEISLYEDQEPADVIYQFCLDQATHKIMRGPVHADLITHFCDRLEFPCSRRRPREVMKLGTLTQYGMPFEARYIRPMNASEECAEGDRGEDGDVPCMKAAVDRLCSRLVPPPPNCHDSMSSFMAAEFRRLDDKRWNGGRLEHYRTLGLLRDASLAEIDIVSRKLVRELGGNVSPYARVGNSSAGYKPLAHTWDQSAKDLFRVEQAWENIGIPRNREFYDLPCRWIFGGAMCARNLPDGSMSILAEQPD